MFFNASLSDCEVIREILDLYSSASGQVINFDKSVMVTSKNIYGSMARRVSLALRVKVASSLGNYLSLPSQNLFLIKGIYYNVD